MFNLTFFLLLVLAHAHPSPSPTAGCPSAGAPPVVSGLACGLGRLGADLPGLPARLYHLLVAHRVALLALLVAVAAVVIALRAVRAALWRRVVRGGHWCTVVPTRTQDPTRSTDVWRLLAELAREVHGGRWRLVRPPLAVEFHAEGGGIHLGVWLPASVPQAKATAAIGRAWPGSAVTVAPVRYPPQGALAAYRLAARRTDNGWLVDQTRTVRSGHDYDPLGAVWSALRDQGGLVQVLVWPVPRRRLRALTRAGRYPQQSQPSAGARAADLGTDALTGLIRLPLDLLSRTPARSGRAERTGPPPPDAVQRDAMRDARAKAAEGVLVWVSIRIAAVAARRGRAAMAAHATATGYSVVGTGLGAHRLRRARKRLADRYAPAGEFVLLTAAELAVLVHLPADPAAHGFNTAARHRRYPAGAPHPTPERPGRAGPGWTRDGWIAPSDNDPYHGGPPNDEGPAA